MSRSDDQSGADAIRVVIADDVVDFRLLVRLALTRAGGFVVVGEAGDGQEAVDLVAQLRPDVVLLDLSMPVLDGLQAIPHLRARAPETKIVVLSGFNASQMADEALQQGAQAYLTKGVGVTEIAATLRNACGRSSPNHAPSPSPRQSDAGVPERARPVPPIDHRASDPRRDAGGREAEPRDNNAELTAANAELAAASQRRDQILLEARHELRNPIVVVASFASMLADEWDSMTEAERREIAGRIERQSRRLGALVDELLVLPGEDVRPPALEPLEVESALQEAVSVSGLPPADIRVSTSPGLKITTDREHLNRILINLLSNAFRHGSPPVTVEATRNDPWVELRVTDCGNGVPSDVVPRLFEGLTGAITRSSRRHGNGLGLSIARDLAGTLGGTVWYEPAEPHGSCFGVRLPLSADATTPGPGLESAGG